MDDAGQIKRERWRIQVEKMENVSQKHVRKMEDVYEKEARDGGKTNNTQK